MIEEACELVSVMVADLAAKSTIVSGLFVRRLIIPYFWSEYMVWRRRRWTSQRPPMSWELCR
jgi:hypothetical protein